MVASARWIARLFGASSPTTMCRKVMIANATATEMVWLTPLAIAGSGSTRSRSGSMKWAKAGSPIQPRPSEARVIPNWVAER